VNRIDGDVANGQIFIVVAVGRDVTAAALDAHFDAELTALADGGNVEIAIEHFDIVGYVLVTTTLLTAVMMYFINRRVESSAALTPVSAGSA